MILLAVLALALSLLFVTMAFSNLRAYQPPPPAVSTKRPRVSVLTRR